MENAREIKLWALKFRGRLLNGEAWGAWSSFIYEGYVYFLTDDSKIYAISGYEYGHVTFVEQQWASHIALFNKLKNRSIKPVDSTIQITDYIKLVPQQEAVEGYKIMNYNQTPLHNGNLLTFNSGSLYSEYKILGVCIGGLHYCEYPSAFANTGYNMHHTTRLKFAKVKAFGVVVSSDVMEGKYACSNIEIGEIHDGYDFSSKYLNMGAGNTGILNSGTDNYNCYFCNGKYNILCEGVMKGFHSITSTCCREVESSVYCQYVDNAVLSYNCDSALVRNAIKEAIMCFDIGFKASTPTSIAKLKHSSIFAICCSGIDIKTPGYYVFNKKVSRRKYIAVYNSLLETIKSSTSCSFSSVRAFIEAMKDEPINSELLSFINQLAKYWLVDYIRGRYWELTEVRTFIDSIKTQAADVQSA